MTGGRLTGRQFTALVGLAVAGCANDGPTADAPALGGAPADAARAADTADNEVVEATIVAEDISFDVTALEVDVGMEVILTFDNRDANVPHNLHVRGAGIDLATPILPGPVVQTLTVTFTEPGQYEFVCDVHPEMRGTIVVGG
jgi:plastocyanin